MVLCCPARKREVVEAFFSGSSRTVEHVVVGAIDRFSSVVEVGLHDGASDNVVVLPVSWFGVAKGERHSLVSCVGWVVFTGIRNGTWQEWC